MKGGRNREKGREHKSKRKERKGRKNERMRSMMIEAISDCKQARVGVDIEGGPIPDSAECEDLDHG